MEKKRSEQNPYSNAIVNALCCFITDYAEAQDALKDDPENEHAQIVSDFCTDFAEWLGETSELSGKMIGRIIANMIREEIEDGETV